MDLPPGYVAVRTEKASAFAVPEERSWVERTIFEHGSLYSGAALAKDLLILEGRKPVYAAPSPRGRRVVRRYHRGGAMARLLGDLHLRVGTPRPVREVHVSTEARRRGVPTPRVLAGAVYPAGFFYRADLVTSYVPRAVELAEILFDPKRRGLSGTMLRRDALAETAVLIRTMASAGLLHPDLNARNILLEWSGGAPQAHVLDLDRCRISGAPSSEAATSMHERLLRSIRKLGRKAGLDLPPGDLKVLAKRMEA